jgi:hypothetical protein
MQITETPGLLEGEVVIEWTQLMPRGSFGNWMTLLAVGIGTVIGGAIGLYNWGPGSLVPGVLVGAFAGVWVRGAAIRNPQLERSMAERPLARSVKATGGVVWEELVDECFHFAWEFMMPGGERYHHAIPIDAFETFETRTSNEWMVGQHAQADYHNSNVIIVDHPMHGPLVVAAHIGPLADLAQLHAVLSKHVMRAREIAKKNRKRVVAVIEQGPDTRSDLPSSL